jgi:PAS domain S-box-containing protein
LTGYTREEVIGQNFSFLVGRDANADSMAQIEAAFEGNSDNDPEASFRRNDGSVFWASVLISPVRDDHGDVVQQFVSLMDLTKHRQEQERLLFLLDELNHRTQNTLATVLAIVGQTLRGMADGQIIDTLEGRIIALSKTNKLLGAENWDNVGLRDVLDEILRPFDLNNDQVSRLVMEGDNLPVRLKAALSLGMVFHELATNALRHGALSGRDNGHIKIAWNVETDGERIRLRWQESGGPAVTTPDHKGFGTRLMRGLARDLDGEVDLAFEREGLFCQIIMPVWGKDRKEMADA